MVFGPSLCNNAVRLVNGGTTLTNRLTIRGHSGWIGREGQCLGGPADVGLVNEGVIRGDESGGTIYINAQPFNNQGLVKAQTGTVSFSGSYTLGGGTLSVGINSPSDYGRVSFSGPLTASGGFTVGTGNGFRPNPGDTFQVLSYTSATNEFACYTSTTPGPGWLGQGTADVAEVANCVSPNAGLW